MAGKKTNRGSRKKAAASPRHKQNQSKEIEGRKRVPAQRNPCDMVSFVRPLWESLNEKARLELLTVDLNEVRARMAGHAEKAVSARRSTKEVAEVSAEDPVDGVVPKDLKRFEDQGTRKVWRERALKTAWMPKPSVEMQRGPNQPAQSHATWTVAATARLALRAIPGVGEAILPGKLDRMLGMVTQGQLEVLTDNLRALVGLVGVLDRVRAMLEPVLMG